MKKFILSNAVRLLLICLTPILLLAHVGYGVYLGIESAWYELRAGLKHPLDTKFSKSTWNDE